MNENEDKYQYKITDLEEKRSELQGKVLEMLKELEGKCGKITAELRSREEELSSTKKELSQVKELLSLRENQVESQIKANEESIKKIQSVLEQN
ncbi:MAG: hypothetical protein Q7R35_09865 [Elusimicrobiota bacterium]|nr:hypothetical protein [Elusimicrobiota bacterium]